MRWLSVGEGLQDGILQFFRFGLARRRSQVAPACSCSGGWAAVRDRAASVAPTET